MKIDITRNEEDESADFVVKNQHGELMISIHFSPAQIQWAIGKMMGFTGSFAMVDLSETDEKEAKRAEDAAANSTPE